MNANREWRLIRALRARPPALARGLEGLSPLREALSEEATDRAARHRVFQAAIAQAEELWEAATAVGPASRPLPLFYSLSQVGRAICAAWLGGPNVVSEPGPVWERGVVWEPRGHGITASDAEGTALDATVQVSRWREPAFVMAAAATESPLFEGPVTLSRLWASLPAMPKHRAVIGDAPTPLTLLPAEIPTSNLRELMLRGLNPTHGYFLSVPANETDAILADYPTAAGHQQVAVREIVSGGSEVTRAARAAMRSSEPEAILSWPRDDGTLRTLSDIGDARPFAGQRSWAVRPRIGTGDGPPPSQLMTMWALLYGLSHLARYQPATWVGALDLDRAETAVPLGHGLDIALEEVPKLAHGALIGRDVMFRLAVEQAQARAETEGDGRPAPNDDE